MTAKMDRHNSKSQKVIRRFWRSDQDSSPVGGKQVAVLRKNHDLFLNLTKCFCLEYFPGCSMFVIAPSTVGEIMFCLIDKAKHNSDTVCWWVSYTSWRDTRF